MPTIFRVKKALGNVVAKAAAPDAASKSQITFALAIPAAGNMAGLNP